MAVAPQLLVFIYTFIVMYTHVLMDPYDPQPYPPVFSSLHTGLCKAAAVECSPPCLHWLSYAAALGEVFGQKRILRWVGPFCHETDVVGDPPPAKCQLFAFKGKAAIELRQRIEESKLKNSISNNLA